VINDCDNILPGLKRLFLAGLAETGFLRAALEGRAFRGGFLVDTFAAAMFLQADGFVLRKFDIV
jgi:hypothetical protein